ncbi:hypothetical protein, partial [Craterilacuibacter sp.]|uniref:hypothetical protein n=1 Tax=Craterilacuibacter sp. TaxID=2870909 RepID=UPI003F3D3A36
MMSPLLHSWLIGLALLLLLCILMLAGRGGDAAILAALASLRSPALDIFWRSITHLGSLWILLPACTLLWALPATRAGGLLALASLIGASLLCNV